MRTTLLVITLILLSAKANACSCSEPALSSRALNSDRVFIGKVIHLQDLKYSNSQVAQDSYGVQAEILVTENLKSETPNRISVTTGYGRGDCGIPFSISNEYIFFLKKQQTSVSICQGHISKFDYVPHRFESKLNDVLNFLAHGE
jgi:hypothetical protein